MTEVYRGNDLTAPLLSVRNKIQTDEIVSMVFRTIGNAKCYDQKGTLSREKADPGSALLLRER
jgi:hypothetical protein